MTAVENIMLAPKRVYKKSVAELEPQINELLQRFGLEDRASYYPDQLSGGQQQRVAIVRALAMEPEIMLFDEITSALDPELVNEVLDVIRTLKEQKMTMILATHEMGFAREVANQICFLDQGEVLENGTPAEIFDNPRHERTRDFLKHVL
jgi:polar amino acid transport system ATP-binding protein